MAADCRPRRSPPAASPAFERGHHALGEGRCPVGLEAGEGGGDDRLVGEHVAGDADAGRRRRLPHHSTQMAPGPGGGAALAVDGVKLADVTALVAGQGADSMARAGESPRARASSTPGPR